MPSPNDQSYRATVWPAAAVDAAPLNVVALPAGFGDAVKPATGAWSGLATMSNTSCPPPVAQFEPEQAIGASEPSAPIENGETVSALSSAAYKKWLFGVIAMLAGPFESAQAAQVTGVIEPLLAIEKA